VTERINHIGGFPCGLQMDIAWNEGPAIRPCNVAPAFDHRAHNEVRLSGVVIGQRNSFHWRSRIRVDNRDPAYRSFVQVHGIHLATIHQNQERDEEQFLGHSRIAPQLVINQESVPGQVPIGRCAGNRVRVLRWAPVRHGAGQQRSSPGPCVWHHAAQDRQRLWPPAGRFLRRRSSKSSFMAQFTVNLTSAGGKRKGGSPAGAASQLVATNGEIRKHTLDPKPEARNPKEIRHPKPERWRLRWWDPGRHGRRVGKSRPPGGTTVSPPRPLSSVIGFRTSFGLRPSDFGFRSLPTRVLQDSE
jgi:hypothetical protein